MCGKVRFGPSGRQISPKLAHCHGECVSPGLPAPARLFFHTTGSHTKRRFTRKPIANVASEAQRITEKPSEAVHAWEKARA